MPTTPRLVSLLAFLALVPVGLYGGLSGEYTTLIATLSVLSVLLIAGSLVMMTGPVPWLPENGSPS
jgi:hypothetical protein